ncbi:MAG: class I SAM-dependent methyltransferase [Planctomycetes bacterium]|nr:class I SAM-dependent methyltransferase [Planctomycetota bacterium]
MSEKREDTDFDPYVRDYDRILNEGLGVSGEDRTFFAIGRISSLAGCLSRLSFAPKIVMDYGCGTGGSTPHLLDLLRAQTVVGLDVSPKSLQVARQIHASLPSEYLSPDQYEPRASIDLVYCNGLFHHVRPSRRPAIARYVADCLRPGGIFSLWENNPWNPGTRYVMSRVSFDRDAIMLTAREARSLLRSIGLEVLRTDHCFIFPRVLKAFRGLEPYLARLALGAQYQVLCRKR